MEPWKLRILKEALITSKRTWCNLIPPRNRLDSSLWSKVLRKGKGLAFQPILSQKDWRGFETLRFDLYNPAEQVLQITVRIDDRKDSPEYADRYNNSFTLNPRVCLVSSFQTLSLNN